MKIQCNVCEAAEANVVCCADEAALCWACDEKVHAANKLASKHQRVPLSTSSSQMPKCDICQEMVGYFFCLEDRALFCRKCDLAIHTANDYVSAHQRFLLTGVKVGLEPMEPSPSPSSSKLHSGEKISQISETKSSMLRRSNLMSLGGEHSKVFPVQVGGVEGLAPAKVSFAGGSDAGSIQPWHVDEFLGLPEFNHYSYMDHGSSKADSGRLGESDCSPISRAAEGELDADECLGQVPEASWMVPQIPSPPTASGLCWPKNSQILSDGGVFVPDVFSLPVQESRRFQTNGTNLKRQWQF
ncbi:B-box zinc finger protein 22 [Malania oleifera]|uniref:B-box zinc finger protein 22 n=1 Tax=Malania oleifera TaxID=397392 RepID=UPI0025AE4FA4|nr:B-box zinc finger protein 22 [Malania oleifera]